MSTAATTQTQPAPPPVDKIKVRVNGKDVEVPKTMPDPVTGKPVPTTMIQACFAAGAMVPHYCYHPKLPVAGNCRMCLVEFGTPAIGPDRKPILNPDGTPKIAKAPRPAIACATPISPGMEIYTDTPAVKQMREGVLEFLLINHPLDCPICDQAGECKLQEYSVDYGQSESRFVETKVHKPKRVDLGPRIVLDDERCILCTRCIRFTRDIVGDDALGIVNRGSYNTLTAYPGKVVRQQLHAQHGGYLPGGRAHLEGFPVPDARLVPEGNQEPMHELRDGLQHRHRVARGEDLPLRAARERRGQRAAGCAITAGSTTSGSGARTGCRKSEARRPKPKSTGRLGCGNRGDCRTAEAGAAGFGRDRSPRRGRPMRSCILLAKLAKMLGAVTDSVPRTGEGDRLLLNADRNPNSTGARLTGIAAEPMGSNLPKIAEGIRSGRIKTLMVVGEDVTRHGIGAEVLGKLDCLIVSDILPNATTRLAHYLLPGAPMRRSAARSPIPRGACRSS